MEENDEFDDTEEEYQIDWWGRDASPFVSDNETEEVVEETD